MILERLSKQAAQKRLRWCLEHGVVIPHPHFLVELRNEALTLADALVVLRTGTVRDEPEHNVRFQQWRYAVEGQEPSGKRLKIIFTFLEEDETLLITAFSVRK